MMVLEVVATGSSYGVELMIRQRTAKLPARCCESIVKTVVRIVHLVHLEHSLQTTFIEAGIVSHERNGGNLVSYVVNFLIRIIHFDNTLLQLLPYFGKYWRIVCVVL